MMQNLNRRICWVVLITLTKCTTVFSQQQYSLQKVYKNKFLIGAALNAPQILEKDSIALPIIMTQLGAITPENSMKCEVIHPSWDTFNFDLADKIVAYGNKNKLAVNGHTLIWHSQLSSFVKHIQSKDSLDLFIKNHITTIASRYDGKIFSWDVVNEALEEDGSLRKSIFLEKLGPDYIANCFKIAAQSAPHTELYYNDYNIEQPRKRAGAITLIKNLQAQGIRIDGVGIQGHWRTDKIPLKEIEESILAFNNLGIKVMFTELDLTVLPNPWDSDAADVNNKAVYNSQMNPYPNGLPDSVQQKLANGYEDLFKLFVKHSDKISRVTFWGVHDKQSWLNGWPIAGRTNYPLLFDRNGKAKPAYYKIIAVGKS
jgi:endo-1,4-beta-xylanase